MKKESYFIFGYRHILGGTSEHEYGFHTTSIEEAFEHGKKCLKNSEGTVTMVITKFTS